MEANNNLISRKIFKLPWGGAEDCPKLQFNSLYGDADRWQLIGSIRKQTCPQNRALTSQSSHELDFIFLSVTLLHPHQYLFIRQFLPHTDSIEEAISHLVNSARTLSSQSLPI